MRISFDLDDTLICYFPSVPCEPRLSLFWRAFISDEPLRQGARRLAGELRRAGHDIWVYTSSGRSERWIRWWLRLHGIRVDGVVNGVSHAKCFGGSQPSKRPRAFGIHLHVDNSRGVDVEGRRHGFDVCVIDPSEIGWVEQVLKAVKKGEPVDTR